MLLEAAADHAFTARIDALQQRPAAAVQEEAAEVEVQRGVHIHVHVCHGAAGLQQNLQHSPHAVVIVGLRPDPV